MALSVKQLQYFVAVAESGVLSHASLSLDVAQSAISQHISRLESSLGVTLLERRARGVSLTPAGARLHEHARTILASLKTTEEDIRTFSESTTGSIGVGLSHTAVDHVASSLMRNVRESCPGVALVVREALSAQLVSEVIAGDLDTALVFNPPDDGRLEGVALIEEDMFLIGTPALIGADSGPVRFADMVQQRIITPFPSGSLKAMVESHLLRNRIASNDLLQIDSLAAMRLALEQGLGSSILGRSSVSASLAEGRLHARRIVDPPLSRRLSQVWLRARPRTRAFAEVSHLASVALEEAVREGRWPATILRGDNITRSDVAS